MATLAAPLVRALAAGLAAFILALAPARAAITPELQKAVRSSTFEVVIKKPTRDGLTYEKPLPLELIPFAERNDAYWPVGTAFAIAPDTYVTAGHVAALGVGSQFGVPGIRASDGKVYAIDRVLKYSMREDYVVFSVSGAPPAVPFVTSTSVTLDDSVFAVGNALGEGIVIRDGLLTSLTPEPLDGKWKYLRFSAAASPGNSGGPLLDAQGRVLGIVTAKSPNENLNYALPIERVLGGSDKVASFDTRESFGAPGLLQGTVLAELKDSFPLPQPFPEFSRNVRATLLKFIKEQQAKLVASEAGEMFPKNSAKLLAKLYDSRDPAMVMQEDDRTWEVHSCSKDSSTTLEGDGRVWSCQDAGLASLYRLQYPGSSTDERRYHDSKEFMDLVLKGIKLPRMVGTQPVRITSFGAAQQDTLVRDHFGRVWQLRVWSLGYADAYLVGLSLPTPDGYVGMLTFTASSLLDGVIEGLKFRADYLYLTYSGTLPQWQAFMARRELRPDAFDHIKLQYEPGRALRYDSPRLQLDASDILSVSARSALDLQMTYLLDAGKLTWDVGGVVVREDRDRSTFLAVFRQPHPADDAGKERRERWEHMTHRDGDFTGTPQHDAQLKDFWIRTVAGEAVEPHPLYEVVYNNDASPLPRQMEIAGVKLVRALRVTE